MAKLKQATKLYWGSCAKDWIAPRAGGHKIYWKYCGTTDVPCNPQKTNTLFSLVYGAKAMIPVEIGEPSLRRELYDLDQNHQNMCTHLDLLPELRDKAQIHNLAIK